MKVIVRLGWVSWGWELGGEGGDVLFAGFWGVEVAVAGGGSR